LVGTRKRFFVRYNSNPTSNRDSGGFSISRSNEARLQNKIISTQDDIYTTNISQIYHLKTLVNPNDAVITSVVTLLVPDHKNINNKVSITCNTTLIDTGNVEYNVLNDVLASQLVAKGGEIENIPAVTLVGYENSNTTVTKSLTIDQLTLQFDSGNKTFHDVEFLVIPSNGNLEGEIIISNRFLQDKCKYDVITELAAHIKKVLGFDDPETCVNNDIPISITNLELTPAEILLLCEGDNSDPQDMDTILQNITCAHPVNTHSFTASNINQLPINTGIKSPSNPQDTQAKRQITVRLAEPASNCDNIEIRVNSLEEIVVDTSKCTYNIICPTTANIEYVASNNQPFPVNANLEGCNISSLSNSSGMSEVTDSNALGAFPSNARVTDLEDSCNTSNPFPTDPFLEPATKRKYYLPVEVRFPRNQYDLSHMDPKDPMLKHAKYVGVSPAPALPESLDITYDVGPERMRAYTRRMLVRKARLYAIAARGQSSKSAAADAATLVELNRQDLMAMPSVLEYLKQFKNDNVFDSTEHDSTIESNPKAFDFAQPQTEEEVDEFIRTRLKEAKDSCSLTPEEYIPFEKLVYANRQALRIRLGRDHAAKVEPLKIKLKEGAIPKRMKNSGMNPNARQQMNEQVDQLEDIGLVYRNKSARWVAIARMVPKPGGAPGELRMIIDYRYLNSLTEPIQGPMPHLDEEVKKCQGAKYFMSFDFLKGFFQIPIHPDSQHYFSFMTDRGVYTPTRIPQGAVDSPIYFHACIAEIFSDIIAENKMLLWIDDGVIFAKTWDEFLMLVQRVFTKCIDYDLKLNIKKTNLANTSAIWCGRVIDGTGVKLQARNTDTFLKMSTPQLAGDLSQFLQGINWMRNALLNKGANNSFAAYSSILWELLETVYVKAKSRKKNRFKNIKLADVGWNEAHTAAFNSIKELLANCQTNSFPIPGARMCLFTDASEKFYAAMLTQVVDWDDSKHVSDQQHVPLATLSGEFKNSETRWRINEKEAYPIIKAIEDWEYLLICPQGFDIYGDHDNLIKLFHPDKLPKPFTKATELRVYNWLYLLSQFKVNRMEHIAGELNLWSDMLSRWANPAASKPATSRINTIKLARRAKAKKAAGPRKRKAPVSRDTYSQPEIRNEFLRLKYDYGNPITEIPTKDVILVAQSHLTEKEQAFYDKHSEEFTKDADGILLYNNKYWIPHENMELLVRICIGAHCGPSVEHCEAGHRGSFATLHYCKEYFWWQNMDEFVRKFCNSCLCCLKDKHSNDITPRKLGTSLHATRRGQVLCMDYLYIGACKDTDPHSFEYILVLKDEYSGYVELIPCDAPNSVNAAEAIQWWVSRFTKPEWLVSDRGTHFKCSVIERLAKHFNMKHHFTLAYCPWSNGTVERVNRDIKALLKILDRESRSKASDWPYMLPAVMSVINSTPSKRLGGLAPKEIFMGLPKYNPFTVLYSPHLSDISDVPLTSPDYIKAVDALRQSLDDMHKTITTTKRTRQQQNMEQSATYAARLRRANELGKRVRDIKDTDLIPNFSIGDYVLVAIPKTTKQHKLTAVWRGPYQIVRTISEYVYEVKHLVTNDISTTHITRMKYYADSELDTNVPALLDEIQYESNVFNIYNVESITQHKYDNTRLEYLINIKWEGFSHVENTWESFLDIHEQVPAITTKYVNDLVDGKVKQDLLDLMAS
jgi:hypothetical protein